MGRAIDQPATARALGQVDQLAFQIFDVGLGQVLVLAGDQADLFPEILATLVLGSVMLPEPLGYIVRLADINKRAHGVFRIRPNQEVDPGTPAFRALNQFGQLAPWARQGMPSPVHDLGGNQAVRCAIHQKQTNASTWSTHATSGSVRFWVSPAGYCPAGGCQLRTSILPVTAAEIRAERRSWSNCIDLSDSSIRALNTDDCRSINSAIIVCSSRGGTNIQNSTASEMLNCFCAAPY